uniref:NADH-ubiquinone oxidoreductase chain 6 n=1 Tax=Ablennes hians TaxID=129035 RepID=B5BQ96_ABLHI|nr:NADH dehydrogenase subunit 6 [Ablennes hians]BAG69283.1 NADH dehydrogenase subunit 6 [Ablennes hians]BBU25655.1 NADH dehydrogenase subunit 6 [Ablennes hians]
MTRVLHFFMVISVLGVVAVASNPSPYFAAIGLVLVAGVGCGILANFGLSFFSLILLLMYLGGMLVVFAFASAMAAEPHPKGWAHWPVLALMAFYLVWVIITLLMFSGGWYEVSPETVDEFNELFVFRGDMGGVALMYSTGGGLLILGAWTLLLTLFVVLELTRGLSRGALRAV